MPAIHAQITIFGEELMSKIRDMRRTKHFIVDHQIIDEYLPAMGGNAFMLYSIYCRLASTYSKVFPSTPVLRKNTGFSRTSIAKYNAILVELGLIEIIKNYSEKNGYENHTYVLLEPQGLSDNLKKKYYPKEWSPIVKYPPCTNNGHAPHVQSLDKACSNNEQGHVQNMDTINNKDLVNNKTTTTRNQLTGGMVKDLVNYLNDKTDLVVVFHEMQRIIYSAINLKGDLVNALGYVKQKIDDFSDILPAKGNPMGFLHEAVKDDFKPRKRKPSINEKENEELNKSISVYNDHLINAWKSLSNTDKASRYKEAIIYRFMRKNRRKPNSAELEKLLNKLASTGNLDGISLKSPAPDFKYKI